MAAVVLFVSFPLCILARKRYMLPRCRYKANDPLNSTFLCKKDPLRLKRKWVNLRLLGVNYVNQTMGLTESPNSRYQLTRLPHSCLCVCPPPRAAGVLPPHPAAAVSVRPV